MATYSIKDLERISGIKAHTLRIWEQRYEILQPSRSDTNIRSYSDEDLKRVLNISILNQQGIKISRLAKMQSDELLQLVRDTVSKSDSRQAQVDNLVISMVEMDEDRFEKYFANCILRFGFDQTMSDVIYPFLNKVGLLWQTNSINPAQEHFISNLIRQKLIVAIDGASQNHRADNRRFLLYLPENEMHEISLLYASFKIRSCGHKSIYLGQSVPYADLKIVYEIHKPEFILTILTCPLHEQTLEEYVQTLSNDFPEAKILISGWLIINTPIYLPNNVQIFNDLKDFSDSINKI